MPEFLTNKKANRNTNYILQSFRMTLESKDQANTSQRQSSWIYPELVIIHNRHLTTVNLHLSSIKSQTQRHDWNPVVGQWIYNRLWSKHAEHEQQATEMTSSRQMAIKPHDLFVTSKFNLLYPIRCLRCQLDHFHTVIGWY